VTRDELCLERFPRRLCETERRPKVSIGAELVRRYRVRKFAGSAELTQAASESEDELQTVDNKDDDT
jgi:hypothetical protein